MSLRNLLTLAALAAAVALLAAACGGGGGDNNDDAKATSGGPYRERMREFVQAIGAVAKEADPDFLIIPQNGEELLTAGGSPDGEPSATYLESIDGLGREDVFYGYSGYGEATPPSLQAVMVALLDLAEDNGVQVMVTDYVSVQQGVDDSYARNADQGYISFAAATGDIGFDAVPTYPSDPFNENTDDVFSLDEAENFLYLIDPTRFDSKEDFLTTVRNTNYDLVLIDLFFDGTEPLTRAEVEGLKQKANGGSHLVIAYLNIGAAEDYRYYWQQEWRQGDPSWLAGAYEGFPDELFVEYWNPEWQGIIFLDQDSYLQRVLDAGFDGAYLDNILAFEFFEEMSG